MKTTLFFLSLVLATSCGDIKKAIDDAKAAETKNEQDKATKANEKTGSRTVTTSTTTTISQSGDQSVFNDPVSTDKNTGTDTSTATTSSQTKAISSSHIQTINSPIVGAWLQSCEEGLAYRKDYGSNGWLTITTYAFDNPECLGKPTVFVQKTPYRADESYLYYSGSTPYSISINGDNNVVDIGGVVLTKIQK